MRVLLMQPTLTCRWPEAAERPTMYEPLGLGYLAAVVRERGVPVNRNLRQELQTVRDELKIEGYEAYF